MSGDVYCGNMPVLVSSWERHGFFFFFSLQMRLGNSSRSSTIGGLVLEHLCPTIQNVLLDGLRDHKLDLIIGQIPNHSWSMVEAFTQAGSYGDHFTFIIQ